jgi:hypothetical protein
VFADQSSNVLLQTFHLSKSNNGSLKTVVRRVGGDLLKRRSLQSAMRSAAFYFIPENTDAQMDNRGSLDD